MISINTNYGSLFASKSAGATQKTMNMAMERLSSGLRINNAKDDAAGQGIAMRLSAEIRSMEVASRNSSDAQSMIDTAEAAHQAVISLLLQMREIAVQAANIKSYDYGLGRPHADNTVLNAEVIALEREIKSIAESTEFAGVNLGTSIAVKFQIGTGNGDTITHTFKDFDLSAVGIEIDDYNSNYSSETHGVGFIQLINVSTTSDANRTAFTALATLDAAISVISTRRGELGALSNRLSSTIANLDNIGINLSSARGRIQDTNFVTETSNLAKSQIMQQAATAMLAQANASKGSVLTLIRG